MPNMSYCMFENTSKDMQDIIDKMYEDDFDPDELSTYERRYYDQLWDQCETMLQRLEELQEMMDAREEAEERRLEDEELRREEYDMHRAIVGTQRADEDFGHTFTRYDDSSTDNHSTHTFSRSDDCSSYDSGSSSSDSGSSCSGD